MRYTFSNDVFLKGKKLVTHTITDVGNLHSHMFFEIAYVIKGKVKHITPDEECFLSNNTMIIIKPGEYHSFNERNTPGYFHRDILIESTFFKEMCDNTSFNLYNELMSKKQLIKLDFSHDEFVTLENLLNLYSSLDENNNLGEIIAKTVTTHILFIFAKSLKNDTIPNQALISIIEAMKSPNVLQNGISELVKEVNYSHGHLCRIIKQTYNRTLLDLLTEFRMEKAAILLKTTNMPLIDLAYIVGYDSLSHFINIFEKHFNISPGKYRTNYLVIGK